MDGIFWDTSLPVPLGESRQTEVRSFNVILSQVPRPTCVKKTFFKSGRDPVYVILSNVNEDNLTKLDYKV